MAPVTKTTLYLSEDTRRRLRAAARRLGRPQADVLREAIDRYLAAEEAPPPSSIGLGADDELTGENSEEWLRTRWRPR